MSKKIVVLGGGISGLTTAYKLLRKNKDLVVTLLEKSNRAGGWLESKKLNSVVFECGPRSLRPQGLPGLATLNLVHQLQLTDSILPVDKKEPASKNRFIYYQNKLHQLPSSIVGMLTDKSPLLKGLISAAVKEIFRKKVERDESIEEFITRRFNKDIANNLISAMVHGIYAGDTKDLSITNTFKILKDYELKYGSIVLGILNDIVSSGQTEIDNKLLQLKEKDDRLFSIYKSCSMYSFDGGIEQLSIKLLKELNNFKGFNITYNSNINNIDINDQECNIKLNNNTIKADHIISCIPSDKLYSLLKNNDLSELTYNPSSNVAVVNMLFENNVMPFHGFGYLVPKSVPNSDAIGVVYDSCPFPSLSENKTNITLMMGGPNFKDIFGDKPTEELVLSKAKQVINDQLNITDTPNQHNITLQYNCIPQYQVDHHLRMKSLSDKIASKYSNKLFLLGASYNGVAINDCVLYANQLVEGLFKDGVLSNNNSKAVYTGLEKFC